MNISRYSILILCMAVPACKIHNASAMRSMNSNEQPEDGRSDSEENYVEMDWKALFKAEGTMKREAQKLQQQIAGFIGALIDLAKLRHEHRQDDYSRKSETAASDNLYEAWAKANMFYQALRERVRRSGNRLTTEQRRTFGVLQEDIGSMVRDGQLDQGESRKISPTEADYMLRKYAGEVEAGLMDFLDTLK
jgi:hypothetical protein